MLLSGTACFMNFHCLSPITPDSYSCLCSGHMYTIFMTCLTTNTACRTQYPKSHLLQFYDRTPFSTSLASIASHKDTSNLSACNLLINFDHRLVYDWFPIYDPFCFGVCLYSLFRQGNKDMGEQQGELSCNRVACTQEPLSLIKIVKKFHFRSSCPLEIGAEGGV